MYNNTFKAAGVYLLPTVGSEVATATASNERVDRKNIIFTMSKCTKLINEVFEK